MYLVGRSSTLEALVEGCSVFSRVIVSSRELVDS